MRKCHETKSPVKNIFSQPLGNKLSIREENMNEVNEWECVRGSANCAPSCQPPPVTQWHMLASQTGSNDARWEMSDKQQAEQKSPPAIHKKAESEAKVLFLFLKSCLLNSTQSNMIFIKRSIKYLCMACMKKILYVYAHTVKNS